MGRRKSYFGSFSGTPEADAFILAHETATGISMDTLQQNAVKGLISRLKGVGTVNGHDFWTTAKANGTRMWIHCPSNDSTIDFNGINIELFSATTLGTFNNFVSGDLTTHGLKGGSTKIFDAGVGTGDYDEDDFKFGIYSHTNNLAVTIDAGQDGANYMFTYITSTTIRCRIGTTSNVTGTVANSTGLRHVNRNSTAMSIANDATKIVTSTLNRTHTGVVNMGFHAFNPSVPSLYSVRRLSIYFIGFTGFRYDATQYADFFECIDWYQTNVITGGRNV